MSDNNKHSAAPTPGSQAADSSNSKPTKSKPYWNRNRKSKAPHHRQHLDDQQYEAESNPETFMRRYNHRQHTRHERQRSRSNEDMPQSEMNIVNGAPVNGNGLIYLGHDHGDRFKPSFGRRDDRMTNGHFEPVGPAVSGANDPRRPPIVSSSMDQPPAPPRSFSDRSHHSAAPNHYFQQSEHTILSSLASNHDYIISPAPL